MVEIAIDLPALGAIGAEVRIAGNRVRVQFWAELSAVARRIESSLVALAGKLQSHGLIVEHVACRYGRPDPSDRKSVVEGKSVSARVVLGGRRIIKKKTK